MGAGESKFRAKFVDYPLRIAKGGQKGYFVYILWWEEEAVYVGATSCLAKRVKEHEGKARREGENYHFDSVTVKALRSFVDMGKEEARLIGLLNPEYNIQLRKRSSFLAIDLLAALGLRLPETEGFIRRI